MNKNELKWNQRRPRSHYTQRASDLLIFFFFCVNGGIRWNFSAQQCVLEFKSFSMSPRTPNLESGLESYNLRKFTTKKRQSADEQDMSRHPCSHATALKQRRREKALVCRGITIHMTWHHGPNLAILLFSDHFARHYKNMFFKLF